MDLAPSPDQMAVLTAVESLTRHFTAPPAHFRGFDLYSAELDSALEQGGFFDVAAVAELGPVTAVLVVECVASLPYCTEIAASALIRPMLCPELPRPLALLEADQGQRPIRFLPHAAAALEIDGDAVHALAIDRADIVPVESLFAYPMGRFAEGPAPAPKTQPGKFSANDLRLWWRVALAAEIAGLLKGAIDSTVAYVSERQQFGRPIGSFQAVRHRLAEAAVKAKGVRMLALKAASTGDPADAALAAFQAQEAATQTVFDVHQFVGAMGITLEHPLHLWTYRLKALLSELGGRGAQAVAASEFLGR